MRDYIGKWTLIRRHEAILVACGALLLGVTAHQLDLFEGFYAFLQRYDWLQLDEWLFVLIFFGASAGAIAVRRGLELAEEMRERRAVEARALALARHDPLTGLSNRRVLQEELPMLLRRARVARHHAAVLVVDLDAFKPVNDIHGHDIGDVVLVQVAERLRAACNGELIARIGGDEFVVAIEHGANDEKPARLASRIIRELSAPYQIDERRIVIGATIGIARAPIDSSEPDELVRVADVAMYEAKRAGKDIYRFFHADMDARLRDRAALEHDLRDAIESGQVIPYFQPVMSLTEDRIIGFEALARWEHPTRGLIAPDDFVPIAEDLGLIDALSDRILRQGCAAARDWHPDTTLSINISPLQLRDPWLSARLLGILAEAGFSPRRLIVEVTENAVIDDLPLANEVFESLQSAGIRIALDDFGKGYSSLSHLRQLHFDHLKIDGSFVRSMESEESRKIVQAVAGLGKALGMPVTAEGVENAATADLLRRLGCEQAQGYLFGRPTPALATARTLHDFDLYPYLQHGGVRH